MLKEKLWTRRITAKIIVIQRNKRIKDSSLLEKIWRNNTRKHEVEQEMKKENSLAWEQNKIIYMDRWIYIPNNRKLWERILQDNYNPINIGYLGQQRMLELVKQNY